MNLEDYIMQRINLLSNNEDVVKITLSIPKELPHLKGHFPGQPVTPSIVLIEITSLLTQKYFELPSKVYKELKRSKVPKMILPDIEYSLEIKKISETSFLGQWYDQDEALCAKFNLEF